MLAGRWEDVGGSVVVVGMELGLSMGGRWRVGGWVLLGRWEDVGGLVGGRWRVGGWALASQWAGVGGPTGERWSHPPFGPLPFGRVAFSSVNLWLLCSLVSILVVFSGPSYAGI